MELDHIILPLFALWLIGLGLLLFRRTIPLIWKISAVLVFVFYAIYFSHELFDVALTRYLADWGSELPRFLGAAVALIPLLLVLLWPFALIAIHRNRTAEEALVFLRNLVLFTLFFWCFWFLAYFLGWKLDAGLGDALLKALPEKIEVPETLLNPPTE